MNGSNTGQAVQASNEYNNEFVTVKEWQADLVSAMQDIADSLVDNAQGNGGNLPASAFAQGHKLPLASMAKNRYNIKIRLRDGMKVVAPVHGFDEDTITVQFDGEPFPTTFYTHEIVSFTRAADDAELS